MKRIETYYQSEITCCSDHLASGFKNNILDTFHASNSPVRFLSSNLSFLFSRQERLGAALTNKISQFSPEIRISSAPLVLPSPGDRATASTAAPAHTAPSPLPTLRVDTHWWRTHTHTNTRPQTRVCRRPSSIP